MMSSERTQERLHEAEHKASKLQGKLAAIKRGAEAAEERIGMLAGAAVVGFGYGAITTKQGGNAAKPWVISNKVPFDTALAVAGAAGVLAAHNDTEIGSIVDGAGCAAVGIYFSRLGAQWETTRLQNAGTPAANPTTAPVTGTSTTTTTPAAPAQTTQGPVRRPPRRFVASY